MAFQGQVHNRRGQIPFRSFLFLVMHKWEVDAMVEGVVAILDCTVVGKKHITFGIFSAEYKMNIKIFFKGARQVQVRYL